MKDGIGDNSFRAVRLTTGLSEITKCITTADVLEGKTGLKF